MYICYVCRAFIDTVDNLHIHLRRHEGAGELELPVRCCQENCASSFQNVWNLQRHIIKFHQSDINDHNYDPNNQALFNSSSHGSHSFRSVVPDEMAAVQNDVGSAIESESSLQDIKNEGIALVAGLRANSALPNKVIPEIITSFNHITHCTVEYLKQQILEPLRKEPGISDSAVEHVEQSLESVRKPFSFLSTKYKQDEYFRSHPLFVPSETLPIGFRYEFRNLRNELCYDTYEYVSIEKNLRSLLQNKDFVELITDENCQHDDDGIITDFRNGKRFHRHFLFGDNNKFSIMIQLFFDEMGTTNPLRGQSTTCNMGPFIIQY